MIRVQLVQRRLHGLDAIDINGLFQLVDAGRQTP
jgi:hypothetical protein